MQLIMQPEDGVAPIVEAIDRAKKTIDIVIFRFDLDAIEKALTAAVGRGVIVRALIAHTNRGGESKLRKLESRLLKAGVTLSRTADDMVRYHGKLLIIDRRPRVRARLQLHASRTSRRAAASAWSRAIRRSSATS